MAGVYFLKLKKEDYSLKQLYEKELFLHLLLDFFLLNLKYICSLFNKI